MISPGHPEKVKLNGDKSICYIFHIIPKKGCLFATNSNDKKKNNEQTVENELAIIFRVIQETCVAVVPEGSMYVYPSWWSCTQNIDSYKR